MAEKVITVDIDDQGNFDLKLSGFKGKGCKDVAKMFEKVGKVQKEELTNEYYEKGPGAGVAVSH